ncbi:F-box protein SKIP23 [Hevea brasiliensis]|uniref:F-box protein SKIP23 n=1 Tax=Hevea brasiliensis TaxID=3981 RepID=UPI0025CD25AD|nr:F-box protein SKIP23 [Hevea brasiliensis]
MDRVACNWSELPRDLMAFNLNTMFRVNKVIVYPDFAWNKIEDCTVLAITEHGRKSGHGRLCYWRFGDENWTIVNGGFCYYCDIIVYKGQFYVVDKWGMLSVIDFSSSRAKKIAAPLYREGIEKFLVESCGDLYLVDGFVKGECDRQSNAETQCMVVDFRVYKLNEEEHDWDPVKSIGDRIFFVGHSSFSTSAQDFSELEGNCIIFIDKTILPKKGGGFESFHDQFMGVFNLVDGSIGRLTFPLHNRPYSHIFGPSPTWINADSSSSSSSSG